MVKPRAIPEPVLTPFPRSKRPDLKPIAKAAPQSPQKPPEEKPPAKPAEPEKTKVQAIEPPPLEMLQNGTNIPLPFKPITPEEALMTANPDLYALMLRQLRDMKGPMPDSTTTGPLSVISKLQHGLTHGEDISTLDSEIAVHVTGQAERSELMSALLIALEEQRLTDIVYSRAKFEDFLHGCLRRSDVKINEGMAATAYFNGELAKIYAQRSKRMTTGEGATASRDPREMVQAVNVPVQLQRKELEHRFSEASPQEREILRKLGFKIQQNLKAARITRTTTETVEVVDATGGTP